MPLNREAEIDDDDIRKAYEAKPQLPEHMTIAFYSLGSHDERTLGPTGRDGEAQPMAGEQNDAQIEAMLAKLPNVDGVYRIPAVAVSGERRYGRDPGYGYGQPDEALSLKKLRLISARAHADVLLVVDHGRQTGAVNGLVAFAPLLLPILFVPMFDARVESYMTAYVVDVRNGYFYGQLDATERGGDAFATAYDDAATTESALQWGRLVPEMSGALSKLFASQRAAAAKGGPPPTEGASAQLGPSIEEVVGRQRAVTVTPSSAKRNE